MDGVFQFIRIIHFLIRFSQDTQNFMKESGGALEFLDPEEAEQLRRWYRRILRVTVGVVLFGFIVVPCIAPWFAVLWYGIDATEAAGRMLLGLLFSLAPAFLYLFAGVAIGCLTVPKEFFQSIAGAKWLELIGTKDIVIAQFVCALVGAVGISVMVGVSAILIGMKTSS